MLELSASDLIITKIEILKGLMEKASCFKVTMINMLKDLGQKADNNKNEQMVCIIRGLDIIKE